MTADSQPVTFSAPWGRSTRFVTILVLVIIASVTATALMKVRLSTIAGIAVATAPLLILAATLPFMILGYELRDRTLFIKRPGWQTRVPLANLRSAAFNPEAMKLSIRIFGNGGLFGFTGIFWNKTIGRYRAYVTDPRRSVVLRLPDRTIIISPENPEAFLARIGFTGSPQS